MKQNWTFFLVLLIFSVFCLVGFAGCGDDDDDSGDDDDDDDSTDDDDDDDDADDDDDSGTGLTAEDFCLKVEACEQADAYVVEGACAASANKMDQETIDCAAQEDCDAFVSCVEGTDDDWLLDTMTMTYFLFVSAKDFELFNQMDPGTTFTTFEVGQIKYQYDDSDDCDIKGGSVLVSVDDGPFETVTHVSPNAACKMVGSSLLTGFNIDEADMTEGNHTIRTIALDVKGQQSAIFTQNFLVDDYVGGIGTVLPEIADAGFFLEGISGPELDKTLEKFYFSDFDGEIIMLNSSAMWCTYCDAEADELMDLWDHYGKKSGKPFTVNVITLLFQDEAGNTPDESDLLRWADRDPWLQAPIMIDPNVGTAGKWFVNGGVPFNAIFDPDGVCRFKMHGYGPGMINDYIEIIDEIITEFSSD